jgi:hypothetical protein
MQIITREGRCTVKAKSSFKACSSGKTIGWYHAVLSTSLWVSSLSILQQKKKSQRKGNKENERTMGKSRKIHKAVSKDEQEDPESQLEKKRKKARSKKKRSKGVFFAHLLFACSRRSTKCFLRRSRIKKEEKEEIWM